MQVEVLVIDWALPLCLTAFEDPGCSRSRPNSALSARAEVTFTQPRLAFETARSVPLQSLILQGSRMQKCVDLGEAKKM